MSIDIRLVIPFSASIALTWACWCWQACSPPPPKNPEVQVAPPKIPTGYAGICFPKSLGRGELGDFCWLLNRDTLRLCDDTLFFRPQPGLDTVYFFRPRRSEPSVFYCDFRADSLYNLYPNECCGDFDLGTSNSASFRDTAVFQATHLTSKRRWLGVAGNSAVWLESGKRIPFRGDNLGGPMTPRRYKVAIQLFQPANDSACFVIHPRTRAELACYDSSDPPFFSMVYLSLHGDCPLVEFDERQKKVRVRLAD